MLFELINPSDPYTIEAPTLDVALMGCILLGQGRYSLKSLDGGEHVPFMANGGGDEWCAKHYKETFVELSNRMMDTKLAEIADCLDSVLYGNASDRKDFLESTSDMNRPTFEAARMIRQEAVRSSMNDIGERAYRMAAKLRKSIEDGTNTLS